MATWGGLWDLSKQKPEVDTRLQAYADAMSNGVHWDTRTADEKPPARRGNGWPQKKNKAPQERINSS